VVIEVTDTCNPYYSNAYTYNLTRDGSAISPSNTLTLLFRDVDVEYLKSYLPGAVYEYCLTYNPLLTTYSFLGTFCQEFIVPWIGTVTGSVRTPTTSTGTTAGVSGISVCIWLASDYASQQPSTQCVTTNLDGSYSISLYQEGWTGDLQDLILVPSYQSHKFTTSDGQTPGTEYVSVSYRGSGSMSFTDLSTVSVSGYVLVLDSTCGVSSVSLRDGDGVELGKTDDTGAFALAFNLGASPTFYFWYLADNGTKADHVFSPSSVTTPQLLADYVVPFTVKDMTTRDVPFSAVAGGACGISVATGVVNYVVRDCTYTFPSISLPSIDAHRSFSYPIPAHRVIFTVDNNQWEVASQVNEVDMVNFLTSTDQIQQSFDLRFNTTAYTLQYFVTPTITALYVPFDLPTVISGCTASTLGVDGVVQSGIPYPVVLQVTEIYAGFPCLSANGTLSYTDFISVAGNSPLTNETAINSSSAYVYQMVPVTPNIVTPYSKNFEVDATITFTIGTLNSQLSSELVFNLAVLGSVPMQNTFVTQTATSPAIILRDPPGGGSYVELTKGSSISSSVHILKDYKSSWNIGGDEYLGAGGEILVGFSVLTTLGSVRFLQGGDATLGGTMHSTSTDTLVYNMVAHETIRTSQSIGLAGESGDVLVGFALIVETGISDTLSVVASASSTCAFSIKQSMVVNTLSTAPDTFYIYTQNFIETVQIPNILQAIALANSSEVAQFQEDLSSWLSILVAKDVAAAAAGDFFQSSASDMKQLMDSMSSQGRSFEKYFDSFGYSGVDWVMLQLFDYSSALFSWIAKDKSVYKFPPNDIGSITQLGGELFALKTLIPAFIGSENWWGAAFAVLSYGAAYDQTYETYFEGNDLAIAARMTALRASIKNATTEFRASIMVLNSGIKRVSFDGGAGEYEEAYSTVRQQKTSVRVLNTRRREGSFVGMNEVLVGPVWTQSHSSYSADWALSAGQAADYFEEKTNTVTIHLSDPNPGDSFVINLFEDTTYGLPVFQVTGSSGTSCPHEPGTNQNELPYIHLLSSDHVQNVPEDSTHGAIFTFEISNLSRV